MKKEKIVALLSIVLVCFSLFVPAIIKNVLPQSQVTKMREIDYIGYVTATGEVIQKNRQVIKTEYPIVVKDVLIKPGDSVKQGQTIVSVDREKTAQKLAEAADIAALSGLSTGVFATSYDDAMNKIPETIVSELSGTIDYVNAASGNFIEKSGNVASLTGMGDLVVTAQISENRISKVHAGQLVEITGSGFGDNVYYGYVSSVGLVAKKVYIGTSQGTVVDVEISIDNPDDKIKAGYTTKCRIVTEEKQGIRIVPYETVLQDDDGKEYVYVFSQGYAIRKDIDTGLELGDGVEVISGITPDEIIICNPYNIKDDKKLVNVHE